MKKYFNLLILSLAVVSLSSCLKDDREIIKEGASPAVIEFQSPTPISSPSGAVFATYNRSYGLGATTVTYDLTVNYTGSEDAPTDIPITFDINPTAVAQYNTEQHTTLDPMQGSPSLFTMPTSVTIPKGQRMAKITLTFKPQSFDLSKTYGLAIRLTSAAAPSSGNFGTIILAINAKNIYDGIYKQTGGTVQRYTAPGSPTSGDALNGQLKFNPDIALTTINANTVQISGHKWGDGGTGQAQSSGIAGIDNLQIVVDPLTNLVTMKSLAQPNLANVVGAINKYDPATKTFTLNFEWNPTGAKREIRDWTIVYKGVR
jgi:hypothetical protein